MVDYDAWVLSAKYRREDEIGTPFCICVDFDTETDGSLPSTVTENTMEQVRFSFKYVRIMRKRCHFNGRKMELYGNNCLFL